MHSTRTQEEILGALRQIQQSPELQAEAQANPDSVLNRLNLSGIARHAVAMGVAALVVAPAAKLAVPEGFWN